MVKRDQTYIIIGLVVIGVIVFAMTRQTSTVVITDSNPVKFDSVRKHPFDVFSDPYHPPERENPYLFGRDYSYQQVGILNGGGTMLPLFGRPTIGSSSKWEYYTMNSGLKLPVSLGGKPCNSDTGCNELLSGNGDNVDVLGLGNLTSFIYDTKQLRR